DHILSMEWKDSELDSDELNNYKAKAEYYVRQHQDEPTILKLKTNQPLTSDDIRRLEKVLWSEVGTKQDYENEYGEKPLGVFVREIIGMDMNAAKEAFSEYLGGAGLDARQIYFVNQIVEYIVRNGMMRDFTVLTEAPFTDRGSIIEVFDGNLGAWAGIRKVIEKINANAQIA
ncbi:MAG: restriction endonuclease subunit R, partial [Clostridia bacterium]|nr:restriction endonuclease subunit R [Clostridia bacterium]